MWNITNGKAFSIPWIIHEYTEQGTNGDFLLVSKQRLKTTPTFALEKQTHLERKQTRFILTLPVAGAVHSVNHCYVIELSVFKQIFCTIFLSHIISRIYLLIQCVYDYLSLVCFCTLSIASLQQVMSPVPL